MHRQFQFRMAASAAAIVTAFSVQAQQTNSNPDQATVIVTANRFAQFDPRIPANITVLTNEDIRNSPATNLPDILKSVAGIDVRSLYGAMGLDTTVDLRGFGDTAGSNTLLLLDGQRLNPIDSSSISWSTIPLDRILRIEIIRGAGTVLYGDQASGGVINIITDKSGRPATSIATTVGSYGYRGVDGRASGGADGAYFNVGGHYAETSGWRHNSQADQQAMSGRVGHYIASGEVFSDFAAYKDSNGMPGSLFSNGYRSEPTQARKPFDNQHRDGYRLRPGVSLKLSDALTFDGEIAAEHENYSADNVSFASITIRKRETLSATPRLRLKSDFAGMQNETVFGIDYYDGKIDSTYLGNPSVIPQGASQKSAAWYVQNMTELSGRWALTVGGREQRMDQHVSQGDYIADYGYGPFTVPGLTGTAVRKRSAYDLGLAFQGIDWRAFGKYGSLFRFANTDELFGFDSNYNPVFAGDLRPQHGTIGELGASFIEGSTAGWLSAYRMELKDEIAYDGDTFANVNLPDTRRQGIEAGIDWPLGNFIKAHATYAYTDATFRGGPNAGNEIPLVSRNKASLQLTFADRGFGAYSVATNFVGDRRYSGDFANLRGHLAGYTNVHLQGTWNLAPWTITAKLINALDKRYAPFAGYSTSYSDYYYYPADPRSIFLSARYDFR